MVVLILPGFTTRVEATSINMDDYPYRVYAYSNAQSGYLSGVGDYVVFISNTFFLTPSYDLYDYFVDLNNGQVINSESFNVNNQFYGVNYTTDAEVYCLTYINDSWQISYPLVAVNSSYRPMYYHCGDKSIFSNTMPSNFPDLELPEQLTIESVNKIVDDRINESINSTTITTTNAQQIQSSLAKDYESYESGDIDSATMQKSVDDAVDSLNNLTNNSGNTLADLIAINNGLTYADTVQDVIVTDEIIDTQTVSTNISSQITGKINEANVIYNNYTEGSITQSEAITQINQYITQLTQLITAETSTADVNAINAAVNTLSNTRDSINNYSELDKYVADEQVKADQEEIEMLNEMVSVMQVQTVENKMEDQQIAGKADTINNILNPVWENKYFTYLIGVSSVLIIACILLRVRYRML